MPIVVLGLQSDATPDQIRKAYRLLAKQHHPDHGGDRARFEAIHEAYKALEAAEWDTSIGSHHQGGGGDGGHTAAGFDPSKAPGQVYVKGQEAAWLRLVVFWCAFFVVLRLTFVKLEPLFEGWRPVDLSNEAGTAAVAATASPLMDHRLAQPLDPLAR